jgi:hypothetical protein
MKKCTKCGVEKDESEFNKRKAAKDGLRSQCRDCDNDYNEGFKDRAKVLREQNLDAIKARKKVYYENNKEWILKHNKEYRDKNEDKLKARNYKYYHANKEVLVDKSKEYAKRNVEKVRESRKKFREANKERLSATRKKYYEKNKDRILPQMKEYRDNNPEVIRERKRLYREKNLEEISLRKREKYMQPCKSRYYHDMLPEIDKPLMKKGFVTVVCKTCGERFIPNTGRVRKRLEAVNSTSLGESNFYCSDSCREACPLYHFDSTRHIDPRSKLYIPKEETEIARRCQTDHLKQLQIDECGHNYCDKCGQSADIVHLHHTQEIHSSGMEAVSSAGHMLMCPDCHMELHKECA